MDEDRPYDVVADSGKFAVTDRDGRTILACNDMASAEHYASLMNQAYKSGYKTGYRAAKSTQK